MTRDTAVHAPALWARVRDDYLAGDSAEAVCARHGVSRSQLFAQARAGGWRRSDQGAAAPAAEPDADDGAPAPPTAELAGEALRLGARAVARGRLHEAQGWVALAARLRLLAKDERDPYAWGAVLAHGVASATPSVETPDPGPERDEVVDLALSVEAIAREGVALCDRMEAGEDVSAEAAALEARVAALEAGRPDPGAADSQARAVASPAPAEAHIPCGYWEWPAGSDGPAGLPPGGGAPPFAAPQSG